MYTVKASGRGRCEVFVPEMHTAVVDRVELGHEVRRACELGEFVLHYQPVVHLESGQLSGLEALIRWQHPSRGLLPPSEFLDVAEATGAIVPLGAWAIREACAQARRWKDMLGGASIRVGVNLSPTQMLQPGLARTVASALATSGLDPAELVLELTEAVMIEDTSGAIERLRELDALGVLLAIDDFGTGFSSLNYVRQLPFRMIKIDKSFIDDVSESVHDAALVRAIVELGRALDVTTVAEGVETADQMLALRELGCDRAQGYYFSHPLPPAEVEALFVHAGERVPVFPSIGRAPVLETPPRADEPVLAGAVA
jgi:EAL domain-containing protein (putative c-di-GMP-specific phosphodiesterase class I)